MISRPRRIGLLALVGLLATGLAPRAAAAITAHPEADGVVFELAGGVLRLQVWSGRVIRVTYAPGDKLPATSSLCVIARPAAGKWELSETPTEFVVATDAVQARVDRQTGAVSFADAVGAPWLAETPGGRVFSPTPVKNLDAQQAEQDFVLAPDESIFGLGQQEDGPWNYRGQTVRLLQSNKNIALPVLVSSRGYGILWDNPAITTVAVGAAGRPDVVAWTSEVAHAIDYYFLAGPELDQVVADYRMLTGAAPMFGKWFYGFWQCREHYETQAEILGVLARYRERGTPIDGVIQDWQYWTPKPWGSHEFDPKRYPDPAGMVAQIHAEHAHVIISVWSRFDVGCENLQELKAVNGVFDPVYPNVWPKGEGQWYDAFSADARRVYWRQISDKLFRLGFDGWWLDATEPELGGHWGEIRDLRTAMGRGAWVADAYPLMATTGVYQGQRAETSAKRVFILTRSAWAGQQRNAAVSWSGDIKGTWEVFRQQIPAGLNFSLSGIPYWNTDIGGFFGGQTSDPKYAELFTRWFQFGAFCPLFRVHGAGPPKEMWRWDAATDAILVKYDRLRYRLLPYLYSTAWQVTHAGDTMLRPLVMDFRTDPRAVAVSDQYLFGRALLVNPVTSPGATSRPVYLPAGVDWYDFWTGRRLAGGQTVEAAAPIDTLPLYVKAGSILPLGPVVQYAEEQPGAPLELRVYRGAHGAFTLYEDDGNTYDYEKGAYTEIPITWHEAAKTLTIGARRGSFPGMVADREFRVVWVREGRGAGAEETTTADATVRYTGAAVEVTAP
jgi:alpha-glucosidase (family GH31 glycosyl hydrolase)